MLSCSHKNSSATEKDINVYVYRITYKENFYNTVTLIALENNKLYYCPNDTLIMTYKETSNQRREITDERLSLLIHSLIYKNLDELSKIKYNDCKGLTKNEYIIKVVRNKKAETYIFPEILMCSDKSTLKFIDELYQYFVALPRSNGYVK